MEGAEASARGSAPFSAGAGDGEIGLDGDRVCYSHFPGKVSREALLEKGQERPGVWGRLRGKFPMGCILGASPWHYS